MSRAVSASTRPTWPPLGAPPRISMATPCWASRVASVAMSARCGRLPRVRVSSVQQARRHQRQRGVLGAADRDRAVQRSARLGCGSCPCLSSCLARPRRHGAGNRPEAAEIAGFVAQPPSPLKGPAGGCRRAVPARPRPRLSRRPGPGRRRAAPPGAGLGLAAVQIVAQGPGETGPPGRLAGRGGRGSRRRCRSESRNGLVGVSAGGAAARLT